MLAQTRFNERFSEIDPFGPQVGLNGFIKYAETGWIVYLDRSKNF